MPGQTGTNRFRPISDRFVGVSTQLQTLNCEIAQPNGGNRCPAGVQIIRQMRVLLARELFIPRKGAGTSKTNKFHHKAPATLKGKTVADASHRIANSMCSSHESHLTIKQKQSVLFVGSPAGCWGQVTDPLTKHLTTLRAARWQEVADVRIHNVPTSDNAAQSELACCKNRSATRFLVWQINMSLKYISVLLAWDTHTLCKGNGKPSKYDFRPRSTRNHGR
jgi:hypothetical protein